MRFVLLKRAGETVDQLVEAGGWTDAPLALLEPALPAWELRHLVYEDGKWFCSLSKQPNLPAEFDETADASHDELPLAMQSAFVEAPPQDSATRISAPPRSRPPRAWNPSIPPRSSGPRQSRSRRSVISSPEARRRRAGASLSLAAGGPCAIGRDPRMDVWQDVRRQRPAAFGV